MEGRARVLRPVGAALLCLALAACGSAAGDATAAPSVASPTPQPTAAPTPLPSLTSLPSGFPATFADHRPTTLPRLSQVAGGLRGHLEASLVSQNGLTASYTATWIENRVGVASITCGGRKYSDVYTVKDPTQTIDVVFPGWGRGTFVATRRVVVYPSAINGSSPPLCEELGGGTFTITFTGGPAAGILAGTWTESAGGSVTLTAGTGASASP